MLDAKSLDEIIHIVRWISNFSSYALEWTLDGDFGGLDLPTSSYEIE